MVSSYLELKEKLLLSVPEITSLTGLTRTFIYGKWAEGKGPKRMKAGKRTLVSRNELERWLKKLEKEHADF
jgi:predicted DNA-binding transcriptional regulator AlpA